MTAPGGGEPLAARAAGPIRVGVVASTLTCGGASRSLYNLVSHADPAKLRFTGAATTTKLPVFTEAPPADRSPLPIHCVEDSTTARRPWVNFHASVSRAVREVVDASDAIIAWGSLDYRRFFARRCVPLIVVSRGGSQCAYTRNWIAAALPYADHLVAVSEDAANAFPSSVRAQVRVIHNGVDLRRVKRGAHRREALRAAWGIGGHQKVLAYLGRVTPGKGIERLVGAIGRLGDPWRLVVVGQTSHDPYRRQILQEFAEKAPGRCSLLQPTSDVGGVLSAMEVFALLSESEGFSNALLEAWAAGVPAVFTPVGAVEELERRFGRLGERVPVDPRGDDVQVVAEAVLAAASEDYGPAKRAQAMCRDLSLTRHAESWTELIAQAVASHAPARAVRGGEARRNGRHHVARPRLTRRPLRVAFVCSGLGRGGAERWVTLLAANTHPLRLNWQAVFVPKSRPHLHAPFLRTFARLKIPVLFPEPPNLADAPLEVGGREYMERRRDVLQATDVLLAWGTRDLSEWACDFDGPIVYACRSGNPAGRAGIHQGASYATHHVAVSLAAARLLPDGVTPIVIWNGIDENRTRVTQSRERLRARWKLAADQIAVGYIGRNHPVKNPLAAVHAVSQLPANYHAVLVGPTRTKADELRAQATSITERVTLLDFRENIGPVLSALDMLVVASEAEGFSQAMIEAWFAGVPVVATSVGAVPELQQRFGQMTFHVPRHPNPAELAEAVRAALAPGATQVVERARSVARRFLTAGTMADNWVSYLEQIVSPRPSEVREWGGVPTLAPEA